MQRVLDYNGMNYYPLRSPEFLLDYYRSSRGTMLVLEQFTRLEGEDSGPGLMRLPAYRAIAHGASGINFFRWRVSRHGQEMHADGIVPQSGRPARRYRELARMGTEIGKISEVIDSVEPKSEVAIVVSYDSRWAEQSMSIEGADSAIDAVRIHDGLSFANISVDAGDPRAKLTAAGLQPEASSQSDVTSRPGAGSGPGAASRGASLYGPAYKIVFAPRLFLIDEEISSNLSRFVEAGGALVLTAGSGVVDEYGRCFDTPRPGPLAEIAGVEVSDLSKIHEDVDVVGTAGGFLNFRGKGQFLCDEVHPTTADTVAEFASGWRRGLPAVTCNAVRTGCVYYLATSLDVRSAALFATTICALHNVEPLLKSPEGVRVHRLVGPEREVLFALNYNDSPRRLVVGPGWADVLSDSGDERIVIPGLDVAVLQRRIEPSK
jgi:beta-galactosidase